MTDIRLITRTEDQRGWGTPLITFTADVAYVNDEGLRNPVYSGYAGDRDLGQYDSLQVRAQSDGAAWYGWEIEYRQPYSVNLHRAELMVKTLRRLNKRMDALAARYGTPQTLPDYLARVADALGVTSAAPYGTPDRTSPASDGQHRWMSIDSLRYWLERDLASFRKAHGLTDADAA